MFNDSFLFIRASDQKQMCLPFAFFAKKMLFRSLSLSGFSSYLLIFFNASKKQNHFEDTFGESRYMFRSLDL